MERNAIGQRFANLADRTAGRFLITDSGGRILLSTWMDATEGVISGMNLFDIFSPPNDSSIENLIRAVLKAGRLDTMLTMRSGEELRIASVAVNGHQGVPMIFWWPITSESYVARILCGETARQAGIGLSDLLDQLSASIARGFTRIRDTLNPDHPVSATLVTAGYAFETIGSASFYQGLLRRAWSHTPERIASDILLDAVSSRFLEDGMQPPDVVVSGSLPEISGDFDLLTDLLLSICRTFSPTHSPTIIVSGVRVAGIRGAAGSDQETDSFLQLELRGVAGTTLSDIEVILSKSSIDLLTGLNPEIELSLLTLAVRLAGGAVRVGETPSVLSILLPCPN